MTADGEGGGLPAGYAIRARRAEDDAALLRVENRAAQLFRDHGYPEVADNPLASVTDLRAMMAGQEVWVAVDGSDAPAGYAVAGPLGPALVRAVVTAAAARGLSAVSLSTFRDVPFNMPFYEKLGFAEIAPDDAPPALRDAFRRELPPGTDPAARVLMARPAP